MGRQTMSKAGWAAARRFLCVRLDSMGDVLMTTPAIAALRESEPAREITLLTSPSAAEVARLIPEIDDIITYRAPWMKTDEPDLEADLDLIEQLRACRFDAAVIFTVSTQSALPAALI